MANRIIKYVILTVLIVMVLGMLWLIIEPIIWWTPLSEARLYVRLFLIMFAVNTFAVLRLYNSIVQNTRFSLKLREVMTKLQRLIPSVERSVKSLETALNGLRSSTDKAVKEMRDNTEKVNTLNDKFKSATNGKG